MPVKVPDIGKLADTNTTDITINNLSCPKCNREFSGFGYVKRHMLKIHNIKTISFKCQYGKKFDDSMKLKKKFVSWTTEINVCNFFFFLFKLVTDFYFIYRQSDISTYQMYVINVIKCN